MRILQLSDTHFLKDPQQIFWDINPYQTLSKIITHIKNNEKPDLLLLTGDLSQDDTPQSYQHLSNLISSLNINTYFIPGNHDILPVMEQFFNGDYIYPAKLIYLNHWAVILLNSTEPGKISGVLSSAELKFLRDSLQKTQNYRVIIALHHHPILLNTELMDKYSLENNQEFLQMIREFPHVKLVLFGHVHQAFNQEIKGIHFLACPSTWIQFLPGAKDLQFDPLAPGYRWIELHEQDFSTGIIRVD